MARPRGSRKHESREAEKKRIALLTRGCLSPDAWSSEIARWQDEWEDTVYSGMGWGLDLHWVTLMDARGKAEEWSPEEIFVAQALVISIKLLLENGRPKPGSPLHFACRLALMLRRELAKA